MQNTNDIYNNNNKIPNIYYSYHIDRIHYIILAQNWATLIASLVADRIRYKVGLRAGFSAEHVLE